MRLDARRDPPRDRQLEMDGGDLRLHAGAGLRGVVHHLPRRGGARGRIAAPQPLILLLRSVCSRAAAAALPAGAADRRLSAAPDPPTDKHSDPKFLERQPGAILPGNRVAPTWRPVCCFQEPTLTDETVMLVGFRRRESL